MFLPMVMQVFGSYKPVGMSAKMLVALNLLFWIHALTMFPYTKDRSARLLVNFEHNQTVANVSTFAGVAIGPADLSEILALNKDLLNISCGDHVVTGRSLKVVRPNTCQFEVAGQKLLPFITGELQMKVSVDNKTVSMQFKVPKETFSCEIRQQFAGASMSTFVTGMSNATEVSTDKGHLDARFFRRAGGSSEWQFAATTTLSSNQNTTARQDLSVELRCFIDDITIQVPYISEFSRALPEWAVVFSTGDRIATMSKTYTIELL